MNYILDKLLDVIFWIIEAVIGLLPNYTPSNGSMLQTVFNAFAMFNQYIPIVEMAECIIAYLAYVGVYMSVKPILKFGRLS